MNCSILKVLNYVLNELKIYDVTVWIMISSENGSDGFNEQLCGEFCVYIII